MLWQGLSRYSRYLLHGPYIAPKFLVESFQIESSSIWEFTKMYIFKIFHQSGLISWALMLSLLPQVSSAASERTNLSPSPNVENSDQLSLNSSSQDIRSIFISFFSGVPNPVIKLPVTTKDLLDVKPDSGTSALVSQFRTRRTMERALSLRGPFGPLGPLSLRAGVITDTPSSPWFWWQKMVRAGIWASAPDFAFRVGGPLNPTTGIFSGIGPMYSNLMQQGFLFFGNVGPLGPLGPLGPMGPMGAVPSVGDFGLTQLGFYYDRQTREMVDYLYIPFRRVGAQNSDLRKFEIVEDLKSRFSEELSSQWKLDTSFVMTGELKVEESSAKFNVSSRNKEIVSVLLIPDIDWMTGNFWSAYAPRPLNLSLRIKNKSGATILESYQSLLVNMAQFEVREGDAFSIEVWRQGYSLDWKPQKYRLVVVGSTSYQKKLIWEEWIGPEFMQIWDEGFSKRSDLELNYLWAVLVKECYLELEILKQQPEALKNLDKVEFWKRIVGRGMDQLSYIKDHSNSDNLEKNLLNDFDLNIQEFEKISGRAQFQDSEIQEFFMDLWPSQFTDPIFVSGISKSVPAAWLTYLKMNYTRLKNSISGVE